MYNCSSNLFLLFFFSIFHWLYLVFFPWMKASYGELYHSIILMEVNYCGCKTKEKIAEKVIYLVKTPLFWTLIKPVVGGLKQFLLYGNCRMGRLKLKIKRLESSSNRQVTYSKRRNGIVKKAKELSILCDIDIVLLMFSPTGRPTLFQGERRYCN